MSNQQETQHWGSRLGVILAVSGSAVGLGNFLRFPGQAAANGGGAFMIPYLLALVLLGIPIGWAEWTMGRYGGRKGLHSAPAIIGLWCKGTAGRYLGVFGVLIPLGVYFWYVLVESWCLYYVLQYLTGGIGIDGSSPIGEQAQVTRSFFSDVTGDAANGSLFTGAGGVHPIVWTFFLVAAMNIFFVSPRHHPKGIEKRLQGRDANHGGARASSCSFRVLTLEAPDREPPTRASTHGLGFPLEPRLRGAGQLPDVARSSGSDLLQPVGRVLA